MDTLTSAQIVAAREASEQFETRKRDNGDEYVCLPFELDAGSWIHDAVREAHYGYPEMLPDDYKYRYASEAFEKLAESEAGADINDLASEFADNVDIYTSDLFAWLSSNLSRQGYCDEAREEGLVSEDATLEERVRIGQYAERREVFDAIARAVETRADAILDEWQEEARKLGEEHARNAASWLEAGEEDARDILQGLEDGDPAAYDRLPNQPNLSGEWADSPTPKLLCERVTGEDYSDLDEYAQDAICSSYEDGVSETFEDACVSQLRRIYSADTERMFRIAEDGCESEFDARFIASLWHGGQSSALYAFSSSGYVDSALEDEVRRELGVRPLAVSEKDRLALRELLAWIEREHPSED